MILPLRQRVSEMMVRVHLIPPDLAEYHVRQMPPSEIRERFKMYVKFGLARRRWEKNEVAKGVTKVKLQIESTSKVVEFNGVPARIWEGHTESGIPVHCFITRIAVEFEIVREANELRCTAQVETLGRTGVEMEALTAVQIGLLTVYDMCKAVDRGMVIGDVRVLEKRGGKSGDWHAEPTSGERPR